MTLPVLSEQTRLLVVAPHPDDETIATGLLIQQVRAAGGTVRILLLTAGDNNPWPQRWLERRMTIRGTDRQRWGDRRHAEILQALQQLDVSRQALEELGLPDMGVTDQLLQSGSDAVTAMASAIRRFQPSLVAMPALDDHHPDHGAAHVLVQLALTGQAEPPQRLTYLVHGRPGSHEYVEIHGSVEQQKKKMDALAMHRSQMALSGNRMRRLAARPERYARLTMRSVKPSSALPWQPPAWLRPWLRLSVISEAGARSWRWRDAPLQRDNRGVYHLLPSAGADGAVRFARLAWDLHTFWIFDRWGWREL
ncbi:MAG TPA: PIG-L deacetylase family protein [Rhodanobacter sp.]